MVRLERAAAEAAGEVPSTFPDSQDPFDLVAVEHPNVIGLYRPDGRLVVGKGPFTADRVVRAGLRGDVRDQVIRGRLVVGVPLSRGEHVVGALRASAPMSVVTDRTHNAILGMAAIAVLALLTSGLVAFWQSRRLARPVARLATSAAELGHGDFTVRTEKSGVQEVDAVAEALDTTASRLDRMLTRERTFSEDASHQLRTPLTSLRVTLESARLDPDMDPAVVIDQALVETDRIEATIDDLLALAREGPDPTARTDLPAVLAALEVDWRPRVVALGRRLRVEVDPDLPHGSVSDRAVRQILDVLVDNALVHGGGTVGVRARPAASGAVIEVTDGGPGVADPDRIFERRVSNAGRSGIGLALARSLAEAEGGRLLLLEPGPRPVFELVVPSVA